MERLFFLAKDKNISAHLIKASDIVIENRVYLKCAYGCKDYGKRLNCPPHVISINEFKEMLKEYDKGVVLIKKHKLNQNEDIMDVWEKVRKDTFKEMLELEKEAFKEGCSFSYLLRPGSCNECVKCDEFCAKPHLRRFSPEAVGINISKTLENIHINIDYNDYSSISLIGILLLD